MTDKDYQALLSAQLLYLQNVMEVPHGTPIAALYLEPGILPIQFEIEKRQIPFLRRILNKDLLILSNWSKVNNSITSLKKTGQITR